MLTKYVSIPEYSSSTPNYPLYIFKYYPDGDNIWIFEECNEMVYVTVKLQ